MDGDITDDAVKWRPDVVVAKLALLGLAKRDGRLIIGLGIGVSLLGLIKGVAADDAGGEKLALAFNFDLVVVINSQLLVFGRDLGIKGGLLLGGIDFHDGLSSFNAFAGLDQDGGEVAIDLGIERGRAP